MQPNMLGLYQVSGRLMRLLQSSVVSCMSGTQARSSQYLSLGLETS